MSYFTGEYNLIIKDADRYRRQMEGTGSAFDGVNTSKDVLDRFGLSDPTQRVSRAFDPQQRMLATQVAKNSSGMAARLGKKSAVPEAAFSRLAGDAAQGYGELAGRKGAAIADATSNQEQTVAQLLKSILGERDQFGLNKMSMLDRLLGTRRGATQEQAGLQYKDDEANSSNWLDDLAGFLGLGADIAGIPLSGGTSLLGKLLGDKNQ